MEKLFLFVVKFASASVKIDISLAKYIAPSPKFNLCVHDMNQWGTKMGHT